MWASVDTSDNVTKVYTRPTAITYEDVNYPSNVMSSWSNAELATIGVYPVVEDTSNYEDPAYYINTNETFTYYDSVSVGGTTYTNTVVGSYGTATPMSLNDTTNPDGTVTPGLKSNAITTQQNQAYGLLQPSDWYVVRKSENGVAIPTDWDTWRESIRTTCQSQVTMINACTTVPQLQALYVYNDATPPVRPLPEFPPSPST
jgi:hypothetical protein|tara:strand:- start:1850 stop:2455 length:606 start_codon:yes stop_codon:yes gene_type:complete